MPTERGVKLRQAADDQISELIALLSEQDEGVLMLPCPGREKLGDGTVAALTSHTADNYLRIAEFLQANRLTGSREGAERRHRTPRFLGAHLGHGPVCTPRVARPTVATVRAATAATTRQGPSSFRGCLSDCHWVGTRSACWPTSPTRSLTACLPRAV